ncbi:uncharacterized protein LOC127878531 [Dreissena polymorpha]|uniref:uncharacterized protein LOC127878531 n=1 Tax=Dreissena polymorpha TaxID=45954 RepID=UPI0022641B65|nr:uncharacterized protein LOC127878531 [Dreissena polymorpha]
MCASKNGSYSNVYDFWIGCFFVNVGFGNYQAYWITDEYSFPVNWTRWALFEPDFMGSQTCTRINSDFNFRTQDCSDSFGILCEKHDTCEGLANGSSFTVTFSNGQKLGSIAYYTCRPGYHSTGEYTRTCTMIGEVAEWSGMELNCTLESCPILQNGSTFSISLSNDHAIGSVATYICLPGYSSSTESLTRTCLHNGMNVIWSGNEPSCMPSTVPSSATTTESLSPTTTLTEVLSTTPDTETITPTIASTHDSSATTSDVNDPIITSSVPGASGARPIFLMPCYCYPDKAFAGMTEQTIIALLVRDTAIRTNETTVAIFRRKCREDKRFSSKVIAWCGELLHIPSSFDSTSAINQCLNAGFHHLAVIDSQSEYDRMIAYFVEIQHCPNLTNGSLFTVSLSNGQELGSMRVHLSTGITILMANCRGVDEPISTAAVPGASRARPLFLMPCLCYPNKTFAGMTEEAIIALLIMPSYDIQDADLRVVSEGFQVSFSRITLNARVVIRHFSSCLVPPMLDENSSFFSAAVFRNYRSTKQEASKKLRFGRLNSGVRF